VRDQWLQHPAFQDIQASLRRGWRLRLAGFGSLLAICIVLGSMSTPIIRVMILGLAIWTMIQGVTEWRKGPYRSNRLYVWLMEIPESIAWVYGLQILQAPLGVYLLSRYRITFVLNDGSVTDISLPAHRYLVVMKWLNRVLPHAEFEWSQERADRWTGG